MTDAIELEPPELDGLELDHLGRLKLTLNTALIPDYAKLIAQLLEAKREGDPLGAGFYQTGEKLVRLIHKDGGLETVHKLGTGEALHAIHTVVVFQTQGSAENPPRPARPPLDVRALVLPEVLRVAPNLRGQVTHPVLQAGKLVALAGYDPETKLLTNVKHPVGESERQDSPPAALELLRDWLKEFAFETEGDLLRALTLPMSYLVRPQMRHHPGPPCYIFDAVEPSSGKTHLVDALIAAVFGVRVAARPWPREERERAKAFLAMAIEGKVFSFDNLQRGMVLSSEVLDAFVTASSFGGRILGETKTGEADATVPVILNGNNIAPGADAHQRTVRVRLIGREEGHQFERADIIGWTLKHRAELLEAMSCILRVNAELPQVPGRLWKWGQIVAAPLMAVAGRPDLFDAWNARLDAMDPQREALDMFIAALLDTGPIDLEKQTEGVVGGFPVWCARELGWKYREALCVLIGLNPKQFDDLAPQYLMSKLRGAEKRRCRSGHHYTLERLNLGKRTNYIENTVLRLRHDVEVVFTGVDSPNVVRMKAMSDEMKAGGMTDEGKGKGE